MLKKNKFLNDHPYFSPLRKSHTMLMGSLGDELINDKDVIDMPKFGDRTQHIFINKKYFMTINWAIV